jgi:hypothetical protein
MEDAQGNHIHELEVRGINIILVNEETESNGHRCRVDPLELVETMKSLRMEIQIYRDGNERKTKYQEDYKHINIQFQLSLNQLKRKIK